MFIYQLYCYDFDTQKGIIYQSLMIKWYNLQRGGILIDEDDRTAEKLSDRFLFP